jgi:hypothetical protein
MTAAKLEVILPKLARLLRRLGPGTTDGEVVATVHAMRNLLDKSGTDFHDLTDRIEDPPPNELNEDELAQVYEAARKEAYIDFRRKQEKARQLCGLRPDGSHDLEAIAFFVQQRKKRIDSYWHQFADDMAARTLISNWKPTEKQEKRLLSLFRQLGGKLAND